MVIQGINVVSGFSGPKPADKPVETPAQSQPPASDTVEVSAAAAAASQQTAQPTPASDIRVEQVEAAKARLAEGTYKLQATVLQVAARVAAFVE